MKVTPLEDDDIGFQMAPMIDITFLLIIFFMAAANLQTAAKVEIAVPEADAARAPKDPSGRGVITLREDGQIFVGPQPVDLDKVSAMVKEGARLNPNLKVQLRADKRVKFKKVREVMGRIAEGGAGDIIFSAYEN